MRYHDPVLSQPRGNIIEEYDRRDYPLPIIRGGQGPRICGNTSWVAPKDPQVLGKGVVI